MRAHPVHRYEELAGYITALVDNGTVRRGARGRSLREMGRQRRTSLSTALQAYRLLEDRGVIEARPRSGYIVAKGNPTALEAPAPSRPPEEPTNVAVSGIV